MLETYWYLDRPKRELPQAKLFVISRDIGEMVFKIEKQENGEWTMLEGKEFAKTKTNPYVAIIAFYLHFCVWPYEEEPQPYVTTPTKLVEDILSCSIEPKFNFNARRIKIELNANHLQLESLGILFDGTHRTGGERQLIFTPITEDNKPPYEIKPGKLFEDIKVDIELVDDINDDMTSSTGMGEKDKSVVTDDIIYKNDGNCPVPKVSSLLSLSSQPSQTVQIDASDPISFLAKIMERKYSACGLNITPFEEFCKREEEKKQKKNAEQRDFIDLEFSKETNSDGDNSADDEKVFVLFGKNKIDVAARLLKSFLLKATLRGA